MFATIKKWKWLIGILLLATVGVGSYFYFQKIQSDKKATKKEKIVIFPFTNLKGDSANDYLGLELRDETIKTLDLSQAYEVIKGNEIKPDDDTEKILSRYYTENQIDLAILGSYSTNSDEIEITAKIVKTRNNTTQFTKDITLSAKNILAVPRIVGLWIYQEFWIFVVEKKNPENIDKQAYKDFIKATKFRNQNNITDAIKYAEKALERQPDFYSCHVLLANSLRRMTTEKSDPAIDYYAKAAEHDRIAIELSSDDTQAGIMLTTIYADTGDWEAAINEYKRLRQTVFDPVGKLRVGSYITRFGGLLEESDKLAQESFIYAPKAKFRQPQIYYQGDYERFKESATLPTSEPNWNSFYLGLMAMYQNNPKTARENFNHSLIFDGDGLIGDLSRSYLLHLDKKTAEGLRLLKYWEVKAFASKHFNGEMLYYLATALSFLGDNERTLRIFKKAVENGFYCYPLFLRDPVLDKLRDKQEFKDILESAHQKHLKFKEIYYETTPN